MKPLKEKNKGAKHLNLFKPTIYFGGICLLLSIGNMPLSGLWFGLWLISFICLALGNLD